MIWLNNFYGVVKSVLDPHSDHERLYSSHFGMRMKERYIPDPLVIFALRDGLYA